MMPVVKNIKIQLFVLFLLSIGSFCFAQRLPVLKQIDLPHSYYYREMYLPQLTSGPSAVSWFPDSKTVVFSMEGSLWRQSIDSDSAVQLTAGPGYDYQPDVSPDGKWIVFTRYNQDAVELVLLDLATKKTRSITSGGDVNVDPRWSLDGKKIAFVSTRGTKHFHVFTVTVEAGQPGPIEQLTEERRSKTPRYYYSPFDHELSPTWSPDSKEIIFVSNPEVVYGTGGFYRMKAERGSERKKIHYEETTWKARPDWSSDGKRLVYSSYLGRSWHQLWVLPSSGGDPFPITYGEFDNTAARWSPDGQKIAFISNQNGNTSLWVQEFVGGDQKEIQPKQRTYLRPTGKLNLTILDPTGRPTAARVFIIAADGRTYAPSDSWIHADDSYDRSQSAFEPHYFHSSGKSVLTVPAGKVRIDVMKGFEHEFEQIEEEEVQPNQERGVIVKLKRLDLPSDWNRWISGDLHVHMNYGGAYRNTPERMIKQAAAENLQVINNLIVNKEQRIPDINYFSTKPDPDSTADVHLLHAQEFHTSFWGHLGLLNLKSHYLIPDYSSYANTAAASLYPTNAAVADLTHAQEGLVGYVHPFDEEPQPGKVERELPADVALGKVDYYEVVGFSDHKITAGIWYRLLNCGFKLSAGAGTDAMANFASLRGPVGTTRVYVKTEIPFQTDRWMESLKQGHTFVTNGPLVSLTVNGHPPGNEIALPKGEHRLEVKAMLRSFVPIDHAQIIFNGEVVKELEITGGKSADFSGSIPVNRSGWLLLRAWRDQATYPILDLYPYATTGPVYINVDKTPVRSKKDAEYFIQWLDVLIEDVKARNDYNTDEERTKVLKVLEDGRKVFQDRL
jgi:TolB protein